jgi:hypothetical protein
VGATGRRNPRDRGQPGLSAQSVRHLAIPARDSILVLPCC